VQRHPALVPLSRDHHHGLVVARHLTTAESTADRREAAEEFVRFMREDGAAHFRAEEEVVLPMLTAFLDEPPVAVDQALVEHGRLRAAAVRLERADTVPDGDALAEVGRLLEAHIGREEREIFPMVERTVPGDVLAGLAEGADAGEVAVLPDAGRAEKWAIAGDDLNTTLVTWDPGKGVAPHRNDERDVLLVAVAGSGELVVDDQRIELQAPAAVLIPRGTTRAVVAGPSGLRYLSVHRRRSGLIQIRR
jgi:quercetin dioxygenase-like cupin family protein